MYTNPFNALTPCEYGNPFQAIFYDDYPVVVIFGLPGAHHFLLRFATASSKSLGWVKG